MSDLGPLFEDRAITGPLFVRYFTHAGIHFYLVADRYDFAARDAIGKTKDYVLEQIREYSKDHRTLCYSELVEKDANIRYVLLSFDNQEHKTGIVELARSPLTAYVHYHISDKFENHTNVYSDIMKLPPYDVYILLFDPMAYMIRRYDTSSDPVIQERVFELAENAEETIARNVPTRETARIFLESLCLPDERFPKWFLDLYKEAYDTRTEPPDTLRDMMTDLKRNAPEMYEPMVAHIRSYHAETDTQNSCDLFIELTSFLLDIYVLLDVLLNRQKLVVGDTVITLTGAAHAEHITRFFLHNFPGIRILSKSDEKGRLQAGRAQAFPYGSKNNVKARHILWGLALRLPFDELRPYHLLYGRDVVSFV